MRKFGKYLFGLIITVGIVTGVAGCTTDANPPNVLQAQLQARIQKAVAEDNIAPGFAIVVIGPTEAESYAAAAGVADTDERVFTADTPLRIASRACQIFCVSSLTGIGFRSGWAFGLRT